jgi:hypothetical protein
MMRTPGSHYSTGYMDVAMFGVGLHRDFPSSCDRAVTDRVLQEVWKRGRRVETRVKRTA